MAYGGNPYDPGFGSEYDWPGYGDPYNDPSNPFDPYETGARPTPATIPPWSLYEEEPSGGGGGGGYVQNPYMQSWVDRMFAPGGLFAQWQKGGYGYDPEWMRQQMVGGEDTINEWAQRMTDAANLDLVGTGRFYSPGTRQGYYGDIDEARLQRLGDLRTGLAQAQMQSQLGDRQAFLQMLMNAIAQERQYELGLGNLGVARGSLGLQRQGYYGDILRTLLGMYQ